MRFKYGVWYFIFIAGVYACPTAAQKNICDSVLANRAFNTTDYETSADIALRKKEDICSADYSNLQEAQSKVTSSGFGFGVPEFTLNASDASSSGTSKISIKDSRFCSLTQDEFISKTSTRYRTQVANGALAAWRECITKTNENLLFISYEPRADGNGFSGTIYRKVSGDIGAFGTITGIQTDEGTRRSLVKCTIGNHRIDVNRGRSLKRDIKGPTTAFICSKPPKLRVAITLITSEGSPPPITLPSLAELTKLAAEKKEVTAISAIAALRIEIDSLKKLNSDLSSAIQQERQDRLAENKNLGFTLNNMDVRLTDQIKGLPKMVFRWKGSNDGTVDCNAYCARPDDGFQGVCVGSIAGAATNKGCEYAPGKSSGFHCLCVLR